jgi:hypothetical protein
MGRAIAKQKLNFLIGQDFFYKKKKKKIQYIYIYMYVSNWRTHANDGPIYWSERCNMWVKREKRGRIQKPHGRSLSIAAT